MCKFNCLLIGNLIQSLFYFLPIYSSFLTNGKQLQILIDIRGVDLKNYNEEKYISSYSPGNIFVHNTNF